MVPRPSAGCKKTSEAEVEANGSVLEGATGKPNRSHLRHAPLRTVGRLLKNTTKLERTPVPMRSIPLDNSASKKYNRWQEGGEDASFANFFSACGFAFF